MMVLWYALAAAGSVALGYLSHAASSYWFPRRRDHEHFYVIIGVENHTAPAIPFAKAFPQSIVKRMCHCTDVRAEIVAGTWTATELTSLVGGSILPTVADGLRVPPDPRGKHCHAHGCAAGGDCDCSEDCGSPICQMKDPDVTHVEAHP